jgi:hypothetical protein
MASNPAADVAAAEETLARVRTELDEVVAVTPDVEGNDVLDSPELLALLLRAVNAKNHLESLVLSTRSAATTPRA